MILTSSPARSRLPDAALRPRRVAPLPRRRPIDLPRRRAARPTTAAPATNPPAATARAWAAAGADLTSAREPPGDPSTGTGTGTASTAWTVSIASSLTPVSVNPGPDLYYSVRS